MGGGWSGLVAPRLGRRHQPDRGPRELRRAPAGWWPLRGLREVSVSGIRNLVEDDLSGSYRLIYADPPWKHKDANANGGRGAAQKYPVMSMGELFALRPLIDSLAAPDCLLAMWWVSSLPREALDLAWVWGFELWTMQGLVWNKQTKTRKVEFFGLGRSTRPSIESCLFARRGRPERVGKGVRQAITAPVREHSQKPDEARTRLVSLSGPVQRIEMFARQRVEGWDAWGNQVPALEGMP